MQNQGKTTTVILTARWLCVVMALLCSGPAMAEGLLDESFPPSWQSEAALNDVCFVNAQVGWAVGDHGTILRSIDRGQTWKTVAEINQQLASPTSNLSLAEKLRGVGNRQVMQSPNDQRSVGTGVTCQLTSVFFLDEKHGWACGGYAMPYVDRTHSVVLRTLDGGVNWKVLSGTNAPAFRQIHFTSLRSGWAVGETGHKYRSGIYYTHDGGNSWSTDSPEAKRKSWRRAIRIAGSTIAISSSGQIEFSDGQPSSNNDLPNAMDAAAIIGANISAEANTLPRFQDVVAIDERTIWAAGSNGAIFASTDKGLSWRPVPLKHSTTDGVTGSGLSSINFETLAVTKKSVWAAGSPGSCIVSIDRTTLAVQFHRTPAAPAIHRIEFVDDQTGFAVGDLGVIYATVDGGNSWELQRGRRNRLDVLNLSVGGDAIPLELLAQEACENNRLCGTVLLEMLESKPLQSTSSFHETTAAMRCGNAVFSKLPIAAGDKLAANRTRMIEDIAVLIRQNRPSCVTVSHPQHRIKSNMLTSSIDQIVTEAIHLAADRRFLETQQANINLLPWQVERLATTDISGHLSFDGTRLLPLEAQTIGDRIMVSRALLGLTLKSTKGIRYRVSRFFGRGEGGQSTTSVVVESGDLLAGTRAALMRSPRGKGSSGLAIIGRSSEKQHLFERLLKTNVHDPKSMSMWQNDLLALTLPVHANQAGIWLMELADLYYAAGKPELASQTLQMLVHRWPEHALATAANLWLTTYFSSDEFNRAAFNRSKSATLQLLRTQADAVVVASAVSAATENRQLTKVQSDAMGDGDQRISWQASDPLLLQKQVEAAQAARLRQGTSESLRNGSSDLAELIRLSGKVDQSLSQGDVLEETSDNADTESSLKKLTQQIEREHDPELWLDQRRRLSAKFLRRLKSQDVDLGASPICLAIDLKLTRDATTKLKLEEMLQKKLALATDADLKQRIAMELAIASSEQLWSSMPATLARRSPLKCVRTDSRPQLDGIPNDDVWQDAWKAGAMHSLTLQLPNAKKPQPIRLVSYESDESTSTPATLPEDTLPKDALMCAYDDQFLYLVASMNKLPDEKYRPSRGARPRDPELNGRDRIEIEIDTDRDSQSTFRFAIDYRGWATESLGGIESYDPTWFVAQKEDETTWTVEAAIPIAALFGQMESLPSAEQASLLEESSSPPSWGIRLQRTRWPHEQFWSGGDVREARRGNLTELIQPKRLLPSLLLFEGRE